MQSCRPVGVAAVGVARVVARVSVEQAGLGRRSTRWYTSDGAGSVFALEVREDVLDHHRIFDADDDFDVAAAGLAGLEGSGVWVSGLAFYPKIREQAKCKT